MSDLELLALVLGIISFGFGVAGLALWRRNDRRLKEIQRQQELIESQAGWDRKVKGFFR